MVKELELDNSDHFQLLFDYKIKKDKGTANTSQLMLQLSSAISKDELLKYLMSNAHFKRLINTALVRPFFGKERYRFSEGNKFEISEIEMDPVDLDCVFHNDDVGSVPVKVTLIQAKTTSSILFQFNHIFIDNSGVKNLLRSLNGEEFDFIRAKKSEKNSLLKRLKSTFFISKKMMAKWYEPKAFIHSKSSEPIDKKYQIHTFTAEETQRINMKVKRSYHIQSISSLFLAACCLSTKELLENRSERLHEFVFQQPYDLTPRREPGYILGNRFSFIHYRLKPEQISTLEEIQDELNKQTSQQIKDKIAQKFLELESILRHVGLRLFLWMISLPAKGKMTSFAYTYIDETKTVGQFAGQDVTNIINIPPVMRKPPVTFGFAYYDSKIRAQVHYDANSLKKEEADQLMASLKSVLLA